MSTPPPESNDEFLRRLSLEFTAERWDEAFKIMHPVFQKFMKEMGPERTSELVDVMNAAGADPGDPSYVGLAYAQTVGEAVLVAVSHWIATHEAPPAE